METNVIRTGFSAIDVATEGLKPSEVMVIAGQGRTGKTSLALSIAKSVAVDDKIPCAFFSMEMSNVKLVNRLISNVCDIDGDKLLKGQFDHDEWEKLDEHISRLLGSPLYIDDKPSLTIDELRDRMRKFSSEHGVKLFIIDSLQLVDCYKHNRSDELLECMKSLRGLADELRVTVITTSMLGSGTEEKHRYPKMSDHHEFMVFNDFADYSVFLYRPDHYYAQTIEEKTEGVNFGCLTIAKRGFEQIGNSTLRFDSKRKTFIELEPIFKIPLNKEWTDEWGVTYSNYGRILKKVDSQRFTCEEYTIPEGVEIMEGTFGLTNSRLRKIHLPSTLRKMEDNTFIRCPLEEIELPEGIIEVPDYMCESCEELEKVVLPSTIKRINHGAFNCCIKLPSIDLPDSIETIDCSVFRYCESLKGVTLPLKITFLGDELFYFSGIESIEIHKNITEIGQRVFCGCNNLKHLVIPESVISIKDGIVSAHDGFEGVTCYAKGYHVENEALIDDEHQELLCCWTQQKNYIVPGCVKRIADFSCNPFVETIMVKQPVILTGSDIFASDTNLKRVAFQGGVTGLTQQTFWNCPKLENK